MGVDSQVDPVDLLAREPDERLLAADLAELPDTIGRPEETSPSPSRGRVVAAGVTLTGVTLVTGALLSVFAVVDAVATGFGATQIALLVVGLIMVATHWGWVHVAELTAQGLDARHNAPIQERNRRWLESIEPYSRWSVRTAALDDGSIEIVTVAHRPVPIGDRSFTFVREPVQRELHPGEEPAAVVAARAEEVRRSAAQATAASRARFEAVRAADEHARLNAADDAERVAAIRAASEALSEQINAHLQDPPLTE
ncbi:MAG: hypothetical protein ACYCXW_08580 [Solirubrobacteraceae bacterium]